jgi:ribonuclease III
MSIVPHEFRDPSLLDLALTHASAQAPADNERLEFLGDAALDLIVAEELYGTSPRLSEGEMTELKSSLVSRKALAQVGVTLDLGAHARVGGGLRQRALPTSVLANLVEAVLGAIYLDSGLEAARTFVRAVLAEPFEHVRRRGPTANPKQGLQHLSQARWNEVPVYDLVEERGRAHARSFLVAARLGERSFPAAWGRTRKEAERWAAHEALLVLEDEPAP